MSSWIRYCISVMAVAAFVLSARAQPSPKVPDPAAAPAVDAVSPAAEAGVAPGAPVTEAVSEPAAGNDTPAGRAAEPAAEPAVAASAPVTAAEAAPEPSPPPPPPPPLIPGESVDELASSIQGLCEKISSFEDVMKLDLYARTAIFDRLRMGLYRETLNLVFAYLPCFSGAGRPTAGMEDYESSLRDLACSMPGMIFLNEGSVDAQLARRSLDACPPPPPSPGRGADAEAEWAGAVRRYLSLAAAVLPPPELLRVGAAWVESMGRIWESPLPLKNAPTAVDWRPVDLKHAIRSTEALLVKSTQPGGAPASLPSATDDLGLYVAPGPEVPSDVAEARLVLVVAALATGDSDAAVRAGGGADIGCRYGMNALLGILEPERGSSPGFLSMVLTPILASAPVDNLVKAVKTASNKLGSRCGMVSLLAELAIGTMTFESLPTDPAAIARLASVVAAAPPGRPLTGDPAVRVELLQQVVASLDAGTDARGFRLYELGRALLDSGRPDDADDAFTRARRDLPEVARPLAYQGKLLAALVRSSAVPGDVVLAARNLHDAGPSGESLEALVADIPVGENRNAAIEALWKGAVASGGDAPAMMVDLFIHLLDTFPGSAEAALAISLMEREGVDDSEPEAFAGWLLLKGRHQVVAGDLKGGLATLDQALKLLKGDVPVAREKALPRLVFWLVESGRPAVAMTLATRAMAAGVIRPAVLAAASRLAADKGFDRPATAMFKLGLSSRQMNPSDWHAIAAVSLRRGDLKQAARAISGMGPEEGWGYDEIMIKGRLLFRSKQYAQAIEQFSRAAALRPDSCQPLLYRGASALINGDAPAGEADFWTCLRLEPPSPQVLGGLAFAMFDQGRYSESEGVFGRALNMEPENSDNLIGMAIAAFMAGDMDGARSAHTYAVEYTPVFAKGPAAAEAAGYQYSRVQKDAWAKLRVWLDAEKKAAARAARGKRR